MELKNGNYVITHKFFYIHYYKANWKRSGIGGFIRLSKKEFCKGDFQTDYDDTPIRLATSQEKAHLDACIKAGKYVEPPLEPVCLINEFNLF